MVQIKLFQVVAFLLAASAIAPVAALPVDENIVRKTGKPSSSLAGKLRKMKVDPPSQPSSSEVTINHPGGKITVNRPDGHDVNINHDPKTNKVDISYTKQEDSKNDAKKGTGSSGRISASRRQYTGKGLPAPSH
jgi:hypothetical protein